MEEPVQKQIVYCQSVDITALNLSRLKKEIVSFTATATNKFELSYSGNNYSGKETMINSEKGPPVNAGYLKTPLIITNRCTSDKKIFIVF